MSGRLYNRLCRLTLTRPTGYFTVGGLETGGNQVTIRGDMQVIFSIEKHLGSEPNPCDVKIINLGPDLRASFQQRPLSVRLDVGYDTDADLQRIFVGDLRMGMSTHVGPQWETKLQLGDGDRAYKHARVSRSLAAGTPVKAAVKEIATSMGLSLPPNGPEVSGQLVGGAAMHGSSRKVLDTVIRPKGFHWSIQDGRLQLLKDRGADSVRPDPAIVINQGNGLIGSPDFGPPKKKGESPTLTFRTSIKPDITPGCVVQLESKAVTGQFKVLKVVHKGDTRGDDWYSEVETKLK